ncbi:MAG: Fe-S oxidoreductase-like protein [Candidatus Uhrbacteria bacterium GW2011_GWF2_39_13]|uniref:Fe-S oxidoreductase-like protein n=1 Tax=Candidatus Uhrbacteria bacterium GW2011_GWF2_39_13 TaxID=1618995 RepID=A0A0G0Q2R4_9BACT|nr:MAG: Fe-S oxidoreductase-like protein [Candidatus Uhrbacteria bacterium GW2011_GWF2_39_13]
MNIDKYLDVIKACRFCFMCRHLAAVGNVTFKESDTPRGRALLLDKVRMDSKNMKNQDYIKTIYEAELSASCRYHCVNHYDEVGLILGARQDIVESGNAPQNIRTVADDLKKVEFTVEGTGDVLYYIDGYTKNHQPEIASAFLQLAGNCKTISGGDCGKALNVLGFAEDASIVNEKFKKAVKASCSSTLVTSCPASYDALKNDFPIDGINVMHSSEYLLSLGSINKPSKSINVYCIDSDYLKNYNNLTAPRELLKSAGYKLDMFGTNLEESYAAGEGAVIYDEICPELMKKLSDRVFELADNPEKDLIITFSPYTKFALKKSKPDFNAISIEEAILKAKGN